MICAMEKKANTVQLEDQESQGTKEIGAQVITVNKIMRVGIIKKVTFEQHL